MKGGYLLFSALVTASVAAQDARPDPAAPNAPVPRLEYRSAFEGFRKLSDKEVSPWREANEAVKEKKKEEKKPAGHGGQR